MTDKTKKIYVWVAWITGITAFVTGPLIGAIYDNSAREFSFIFCAVWGLWAGAVFAASFGRFNFEFFLFTLCFVGFTPLLGGAMFTKGGSDPGWTIPWLMQMAFSSLAILILPLHRLLLEKIGVISRHIRTILPRNTVSLV